MKLSDLGKAKLIISQMMVNEHDEHANLIAEIKERISSMSQLHQDDLLLKLSLVYKTKIQLLETIFEKLKDIK